MSLLLSDMSTITWLPGASGMLMPVAAGGSLPVHLHAAWCNCAECLCSTLFGLRPVG